MSKNSNRLPGHNTRKRIQNTRIQKHMEHTKKT